MRFSATPWVAVLAGLFLASPAPAEVTRYLTGSAADVSPNLHGPVLNLAGGGTDVDAALQSMIDIARGCTDCATTLDVVVLRASGADGYNDYLYAMNGVDSVESLVITSRAEAETPAVVNTVAGAEVVFFAGGDQCNYVTRIRGTATGAAVEGVYSRGGAVGGTSAGMAIMGELVFDACNDTAFSQRILADPYQFRARFTYDFFTWPGMAGILTDTHFVARDRMGRLLTFLARQVKERRVLRALGVAADEQTAILIDSEGKATVYGNALETGESTGTAYFVLADHVPGPGEVVRRKQPLTYLGYKIWVVSAGGRFDLGAWESNGPPTKTISVIDGVIEGDPY